MKSEKRGAGRPKGSGVKNDDASLNKIAAILLDNPTMKATTALRRVLKEMPPGPRESDVTLIRRWQGRWKANSEHYLEAARAKRREITVSVSSPRSYGRQRATDQFMETLRRADAAARLWNTSEMTALHKAVMGYIDSPAHRAVQDFMKSSAFRAIQEPAFMRQMREQQEMFDRIFPKDPNL